MLLLWNTPVVYPVKVFVVFLHEMSHALAGILTGGKIDEIVLSPSLGGACWVDGGWSLLILWAGYLGSMLLGGLILAARTNLDKLISIVIGLVVFIITVLYVTNPLGVLFGIVFGIGMMVLGYLVREELNKFILQLVGLTSVLYVIIDIQEDLVENDRMYSDTWRMSREYFGDPVVWGWIWMLIAIGAAMLFLKLAIDTEVTPNGKDAIQTLIN